MNKILASLVCCSLALPIILSAEQNTQRSPSQKKITRSEMSQKDGSKTPKTQNTSASAPKNNQNKTNRSIVTNQPQEKKPAAKKTSKSSSPVSSPVLLVAADEKKPAQKPALAAQDCGPGANAFRASISHKEGGGIGYPQGYTSLDLFFAFKGSENVRPFFDLRGHLTNDSKAAGNIGAGLRFIPDDINAVFGINGFFDIRRATYSTFEQIGAGFEVLGTQWSLNINGYFPIINTDNVYRTLFKKFQGHSAIVRIKHELALTGGEVIVGRSLIHRGFYDLDAYLGGYYFSGKMGLKAPGGYIKLASNISKYFSLEVQGSYDSLYKGILQGGVSLNIPLGERVRTGNPSRSCYVETALDRNLTDPVSRFEMIVSHLASRDVEGLDIRTNKPLKIVFVNNTSAGSATSSLLSATLTSSSSTPVEVGTAEAPFPTMAEAVASAKPGDMIYVYTGDATDRGLTTAIALQNNQWLQGSHGDFYVGSSYGNVFVPAQTINYPFINVSGAKAITLANDCIVSGLQIQSDDTGIYGESINNGEISHNYLTSTNSLTTGTDISLQGISGNFDIITNKSEGNIGLGITTPYNFNANIYNNRFYNNGQKNLSVLVSGNSKSSINITNNAMSLSQNGLTLESRDGAKFEAVINNNRILDLTGSSLAAMNFLNLNTSNGVCYIENNYVDNQQLGISVSVSNDSGMTYVIYNNRVIAGGGASTGIQVATDNDSRLVLTLTNNVSSSNSIAYYLSNLNSNSNFFVKSTDGALDGVQNLNQGEIDTSGSIQYIPTSP